MIVKERFERNPTQKLEVLKRQAQQLNSSFLTVFDIIEDIKLRTLKVYVEYFPFDLSQQIAKNIKKATRFSQEELFAMLYSSLNGLACLEKINKPHGFITPNSLFRIKKQVYKLHDNFILAEPKSLYAQALAGKHRKYLASELVRDLVDKKQTPSAYDPFKADIFSLGMCVLDAGLLGIHDDYIDMVTKQFDIQKLQESLKLFGEMYPGPNFAILKQMLTLDLSKRPTASSLLKDIHNQAFNSNQFFGGTSASNLKMNIQKQPKQVSFVDYYTIKYDQAIEEQIRKVNLMDTVSRPRMKNFRSETTQMETPPRLANRIPWNNEEQKFFTPRNNSSTKDSENSDQKNVDSVFSTPNKNNKTMECTPEKSIKKGHHIKHPSELLPKKTPTVPINQTLFEKETALNRIIRESLERSEKNLDFIYELITPQSHKGFANDSIKPNFDKDQKEFAEDFFENIPIVMSTQASVTPKHHVNS